MDKKIIAIAGIIFALTFVLMLSIVFGLVSSLNSDSVDSLNSSITSIKDTELQRFNNKIVSGRVVKETIESFRETSKGVKLGYAVCNQTIANDSANWNYYGYGGLYYNASATNYISATTQSTVYKVFTPPDGVVNTLYIEDTTKYRATLVSNSQGVVVGIAFAKTA